MALPVFHQDNDFCIYRAPHDVNGNSRYVVHFLVIPFYNRFENETFINHISDHQEYARRALRGRNYQGKQFGGGIVFQSYNPAEYVRTVIANAEADVIAIWGAAL